tara:strand:- start:10007 stop:10234 length:228 start_codon:yes stop_codon:yes gene_type:complete
MISNPNEKPAVTINRKGIDIFLSCETGMMPYPMVTDLPGQSIEIRYFIKYFKTYDYLGFIETDDESRFRYGICSC